MNKDNTSAALPGGSLLKGCYRISKMLGEGGFGLTYLATMWDNPVQGGLVVIKEHFPLWCATRDKASGAVLINAGEEKRYEWSLNSFKQEAQRLSILNHANIIRVTDAFEENNTAYYVMPYVQGGSLADGSRWLQRHGLMLSQVAVLKLLRALLSALDHMHHSTLRGVPVYHLDIKPGNILLAHNDIEELPVLIDFGSPEMGSPGFMPHEQRCPEEIGPWTDIYALAASIHKLLTGKAPASHLDDHCEVLSEPPCRPLLAHDEKLRSCYDVELLESIDRALSWEPEKRYSDAAQWLSILDSIPLRWPDHGVDLLRLMTNIRTAENGARKSAIMREWGIHIAIALFTASVASFAGLALLRNSESRKTASELPAVIDDTAQIPDHITEESTREAEESTVAREAARKAEEAAAREAARKAKEEAAAREAARKAKSAAPLSSHVCPSNPQSARPGRPSYLKLQEGDRMGCKKCSYWLNAVNNR